MKIDAVVRAAHILQAQPGYTMPFARLHAQLVRELGPEAGSYHEIYQHVRRRADFVIVDSPRVLGAVETWPGAVREAYENALDHAGLGCCVRVALADPPPQEAADLIDAVGATMAALAARSGEDQRLREYVGRATVHVAELTLVVNSLAADRPTIPPPDPPPAT